MKNNKKTIWLCIDCYWQTSTLHEVFFGTAGRDICVKNNIQVPLCFDCHYYPHDRHIIKLGKSLKIEKQIHYCKELNIDFQHTLLATNKPYIPSSKDYLERIKDGCLEKLKEWEL